MRRVLVIGGGRFVGRHLAHRLVLSGARVTLLHRGGSDDGLGPHVERLVADRRTDEFDRALARRTFDAAVDFAAFEASDVERAVRVLGGRVGHYVCISSGQVYLVREGCEAPYREGDYEGPVMPAPTDPFDRDEWQYGVDKRAIEDVLARATDAQGFPASRLRVPVLHGPGDPKRRLERLVARALDGGPVLVPRPDAPVRHVHGPSLARWIAKNLEDPRWIGAALNVAPTEVVSVRAIVARVLDACGSAAPRVEVGLEELASAGLRAEDVGPFGGRWSSNLDPSRVHATLGFEHPPLDAWLPGAVDAIVAHHASAPPSDVSRHRDAERALGERLLAAR